MHVNIFSLYVKSLKDIAMQFEDTLGTVEGLRVPYHKPGNLNALIKKTGKGQTCYSTLIKIFIPVNIAPLLLCVCECPCVAEV